MKKHNSLTFKQELISSLILILIFCGFGAFCFFITVPYYNDERGWIIPVLTFFAGICQLVVILDVKLKYKIQQILRLTH